jgi:histone-lysine N-methyltransferase SUV39H
MEAATQRHFFSHGKAGLEREKQNCHWCQLRSFPTHKTVPITVVNHVDDAVLPRNFRFINKMVLGKRVEAAEDSFRSGCSCGGDGAGCQYGQCQCLADLDDDGDEVKAYAYHSHGERAGKLRSRMLNSSLPLYECHLGCSCSSSCPNRVVERGRTVPLEIFRTKQRGWGVRTTEDIKQGQFVDCYLGEIITAAEADRRRAESAVAQRKDVYLFALDKFTNPESLDSRLQGPPLEVDGEFMSGPTRFINHSCDPNLKIFARVGDHADKHIHDLALFALRDILKGEELTFDYIAGIASDDDDPEDPTNMTECLCGSANCRRYLW